MKINTTIEVWKRGAWFIARSQELEFVSQGRTADEARANLLEVVQIQFDEMREIGTLDDYLEECGYHREGDAYLPLSEMIGFEKRMLQVA